VRALPCYAIASDDQIGFAVAIHIGNRDRTEPAHTQAG
jgi:hypothetical protein